MIDVAAIQNTLYAWALANATGITTVIWASENGARPSVPYIELRIASILRIGRDFQSRPSSSGNGTLFGNREFTVFARGFGDGSLKALEALVTSVERGTVQDTLRAATPGLACLEGLAVQNITGLYDTKFQERGSADFRFRTWSEIVDQPGYIGIVSGMEGTLDQPAPTPDLVTTFTIP